MKLRQVFGSWPDTTNWNRFPTAAPYETTTQSSMTATTDDPLEDKLWWKCLEVVLTVIQAIGEFEVEHLSLTLTVVSLLCLTSWIICIVSVYKAIRNRSKKSKKVSSEEKGNPTTLGYIQPIYVNHASGDLSLNGPAGCNCAQWAGSFDGVPKNGRNMKQDYIKQLENWELEKDVLRL